MKKICLIMLCVSMLVCGCSSKENVEPETEVETSLTNNKNNSGILGLLNNSTKEEKTTKKEKQTKEQKTTEKQTTAKYTKAQLNEASVEYLGNKSAQYENGVYTILFSFLDEEHKELWMNCSVDIVIKNGDKEVYSSTKTLTKDNYSYWENYLGKKMYCASIEIKEDEITKGNSDSGTVYIDVTGGEFGLKMFEKCDIEIDNLPKISAIDSCHITVPNTPLTLNDYYWGGDISSKIIIEKIDVNMKESYDGTIDLTLIFTGKKTFGEYGITTFVCRIIDEEGYVIDSRTVYSDELYNGDKFNNLETYFYNLKPGKYKLEIIEDK